MPVTRRSAIAFVLFVLSGVAFLYFVLPKLAGLGATAASHRGRGHLVDRDRGRARAALVRRLRGAVPRGVRARTRPIGWRESYQITMAGLAATRLFAAAGAGGVALTAWALRRSGMEARLVACRMVAFMVLLYVVYAGSLLIDGIGLGTGLFPGGGSFAITIVPAIVAALLFAVAGAMALAAGGYRAAPGALGGRLGAGGSLAGARGDGARAGGERHAHRDRAGSLARSGPAGRAGLVGL